MRKVLVIGIGAGNPDYVTVQAVKAMNEADVFFFLDKGREKEELVNIRKTIVERFVEGNDYRIVEVASPDRDAGTPDYKTRVLSWHRERAALLGGLIAKELKEDECGAFLVWGDPSLYDSTLRVIDHILADGAVKFDYEVIPGITSVQALTARHRTTLNAIGEAVHITTGRNISKSGVPDNAESAVVMLDDGTALRTIADKDIEIFWGAYLGTPDEVLISGKLSDRIDEIERVRAEGKTRKGWIMDTYILRKSPR